MLIFCAKNSKFFCLNNQRNKCKLRLFWVIFKHCESSFLSNILLSLDFYANHGGGKSHCIFSYISERKAGRPLMPLPHGVWKSQKKSHSTLRAKRATFTLRVYKSSLKMLKMFNLTSYWKPQACGQTALPDKSIVIGQKLVENAKIEKLNCDILGDF